jgi:hypothetical protein
MRTIIHSDEGLFFRPGGHGAFENLNNLDADIVFIKNIDNVIQNKIEKRLVISISWNLDRITVPNFKYLHAIEAEEVREESIDEIVLF